MSNIKDGWSIEYDCKPIPLRTHDWNFSHENYDGENGLCGTGSSLKDCVEQIEEIELAQDETK